jgi:hypothetical protein
MTIATKAAVIRSDRANRPSSATAVTLSNPANVGGPRRSQCCSASHITTRIGSTRNAATPKRLGASSR